MAPKGRSSKFDNSGSAAFSVPSYRFANSVQMVKHGSAQYASRSNAASKEKSSSFATPEQPHQHGSNNNMSRIQEESAQADSILQPSSVADVSRNPPGPSSDATRLFKHFLTMSRTASSSEEAFDNFLRSLDRSKLSASEMSVLDKLLSAMQPTTTTKPGV